MPRSDCIFWSVPFGNCDSKHSSEQKCISGCLTDIMFYISLPLGRHDQEIFFCYYYCCKSWKQVSLFVPFRSDIYGLIIWHHWINSAESQELCTATTAQIVCLNTHSERFAFLKKALWESCTLERNDVQLNAMWAVKPQLLWKRFKKLAIVMFYCNFCKCILELKCVFL